MNLYRDKQVRHFSIFLLFFTLLFVLLGMRLYTLQEQAVRHLVLSHDQAVAASLIEQGVSKEVIARSITHTSITQDGSDLLTTIGITEHTTARFLPFISELSDTVGFPMLITGVSLMILLFTGTYIFLWNREKLYQQTSQIVTAYIKGDFSRQLPQLEEGSFHRFLTSVNQLATILQAKNETQQKAKIFLKSTIADISHQLKTPLTALTIYNEIIMDEPDNKAIVAAYSEKTSRSLKRMEQLILALLKITRLDVGSITFEQKSHTITELISQSTVELTARALREGKDIVITGSTTETMICDLQWTTEAIGNIIKNALDHTERGGKIHISWAKTPEMTRISITDNGSGIAAEDLYHIFKRFYRSKNSIDMQGLGLGLSLAQSIIDGQGGNISVQSNIQEGTTFILSFLTKM